MRVFRTYAWIIVPCALILIFAGPLVFYQLPNNFDTLTESFEPLKTLKFVYSRGRAFHKWGPMPNFIYAPVYAVPMAYWYAHGDMGTPGTTYPYGFKRPFEQQGVLIALGRITGLLLAIAAIVVYGDALARMTGSRLAAFLALTLCVATSSRLLLDFVSTKPDGLMLAFLALSMAVYTDVVTSDLTWQKGCLLSVLAVCSISCKELTAALYIPLYAGLGLHGIVRPAQPAGRRRFVIDFVVAVGVGVLAYLLLNVVYAPATWRLRMAEWLSGPGMDPRVWAPPGYTRSAFLRDALRVILDDMGIGAAAVVGAALVLTAVTRIANRVLLWLPAVGFVVCVLAIAGYLPDYFFSPLNVALALPVAAALAYAEAACLRSQRSARLAGLTIAVLLCLSNLWAAGSVWVGASLSPASLEEKYCLTNVRSGERVHTSNFWARQPGADRLSYLGFDIDDRALGEVMARNGRSPDVILISRDELIWLEEFRVKPARDAMMAASGYHYKDFPGFEALGYRMERVIQPQVPRIFDVPWIRDLCLRSTSGILVFRRLGGGEASSLRTIAPR